MRDAADDFFAAVFAVAFAEAFFAVAMSSSRWVEELRRTAVEKLKSLQSGVVDVAAKKECAYTEQASRPIAVIEAGRSARGAIGRDMQSGRKRRCTRRAVTGHFGKAADANLTRILTTANRPALHHFDAK